MTNTREDNITALNERLKGFEVAMLTTLQPRDGSLHSRPMMIQKTEFDGSLWFFSKFSSAKVDEIRAGSQVNLSFSAPAKGQFISLAGVAYMITDRKKMNALWDDVYRAWFPRGLDEPDLILLRVEVTEAEIWDSTSGENGVSVRFNG